jgi:hypothetical protein
MFPFEYPTKYSRPARILVVHRDESYRALDRIFHVKEVLPAGEA